MDETGVMPPFQGTAEDRAALAAYLVSLHTEGQVDREIAREHQQSSAADTLQAAADGAAAEDQR